MNSCLSQCRSRRSRKGSAIAEFAPVLFILFAIILPAFIGLLSFASGAATLYFATISAARAAMPAPTQKDAINNMTNIFSRIVTGPFGKFGGVDATAIPGLKVRQTEIATGAVNIYTPPLNTNLYSYQYVVTADQIQVKPLFYPGGSPIPMTFTDTVTVEHPEGI